MVRKKKPQKEEVEPKRFEDIELEGLGDIHLETPDIILDDFELKLKPFIIVSDQDLKKIVETIQELGDITGREPEEIVQLIRTKWDQEGGSY